MYKYQITGRATIDANRSQIRIVESDKELTGPSIIALVQEKKIAESAGWKSVKIERI